MTFMISSVRNLPFPDVSLPGLSERRTSNKRKSLCLLPSSSPAKVIRIGRFSSIVSASVSSLSSSSFSHELDSPAARKSPPTCTVSLENVTVNTSSDTSSTSSSPFEVVDINVIPFPSSSTNDSPVNEYGVEEKEEQLPFPSRRRRSNHLLLRGVASSTSSGNIHNHRRSSSAHKKENSTSPCRLSQQPSVSKPSARSTMTSPSSAAAQLRQPKPRPKRERGDVRFTALVRRSVMQGLMEGKEELDSNSERMDVDEGHVAVMGSGSITYDILHDEANSYDRETFTMQDHILVDRLGRYLSEWGYREAVPSTPYNSTASPIHISPVCRASAPSVTVSTISTVVPTATFAVNSHDSAPVSSSAPKAMEIERPGSPVARFLSDEDVDAVSSTSSRSSDSQDLSDFDPALSSTSHASTISPSAPIPIPIPIPVPPARSQSSVSASGGRVLTPPQLVATLVLRHRDKTAVRPRGCGNAGDGALSSSDDYEGGRGKRKRSPLACEL